jgi:hypothetical protein
MFQVFGGTSSVGLYSENQPPRHCSTPWQLFAPIRAKQHALQASGPAAQFTANAVIPRYTRDGYPKRSHNRRVTSERTVARNEQVASSAEHVIQLLPACVRCPRPLTKPKAAAARTIGTSQARDTSRNGTARTGCRATENHSPACKWVTSLRNDHICSCGSTLWAAPILRRVVTQGHFSDEAWKSVQIVHCKVPPSLT